MDSKRVLVGIFLGGMVIVLLCLVMGMAGFVVGRQTMAQGVEEAQVMTVPAVEATVEMRAEADAATRPGDPPLDAPETEPPTASDLDATVTPAPSPVPNLERNATFTQEDLDILWEVYGIIEDEYDGEIPGDAELSYAAIRGLLDALDDRFTRFAPPDVAARMREDLEGSFEGIGAFVTENEEGLTEMVRPMDGQPADLAGVKAGDVVIAVDGEDVVGKSLDEVIALIRGPRGSDVTITFRREGLEAPIDITITRDRIEIPVIQSEMLPENIGYVWLTSFNRNADEQLRAAVDELLAQNPRGLILDLRDNPGGFLDQSIAVADLFLPEGVVLYERSMTLGIDQTYRSDNGDSAEEIPLVVLVNAGSASASEIVAGAIRDNGRGVLIGETTFGKGSVQQSHTLSDGSELRVTIARWYIPSNQSIDGEGIQPDIEVATPEDLGGEEDPQLQRAIDYLLTGE